MGRYREVEVTYRAMRYVVVGHAESDAMSVGEGQEHVAEVSVVVRSRVSRVELVALAWRARICNAIGN